MAPQPPGQNSKHDSREATHQRKRKRSPSPVIQYKVEYREKKKERTPGLLLIQTVPWHHKVRNYTRIAYGHSILHECRRECIRKDLKAYALISVAADRPQVSIREVWTHDKRRGFLFPTDVVRDVERRYGRSRRPLDEEITTSEGTKSEIFALMEDQFPRLPFTLQQSIFDRAWNPNHPNRVGHSKMALPLKIQAAVVAHIRHRHSNYDELLDRNNLYQTRRGEARESVTMTCIRKLHEWRGEEMESSLELFEEVIDLTEPVTKRPKRSDTQARPASAPNALTLPRSQAPSPSVPTINYDQHGRPYVHGSTNGSFDPQSNVQAVSRGTSSSPNTPGVLDPANLTTVYDEEGNRPFVPVNENSRDASSTPLPPASLNGSPLPDRSLRSIALERQRAMLFAPGMPLYRPSSNRTAPPPRQPIWPFALERERELQAASGMPLRRPSWDGTTPLPSPPTWPLAFEWERQLASRSSIGIPLHRISPNGNVPPPAPVWPFALERERELASQAAPGSFPAPGISNNAGPSFAPRQFATPMKFTLNQRAPQQERIQDFDSEPSSNIQVNFPGPRYDYTPPGRLQAPLPPPVMVNRNTNAIDLMEDEEDQPHVAVALGKILAPVPVSSKLKAAKLEDTVVESIEKA